MLPHRAAGNCLACKASDNRAAVQGSTGMDSISITGFAWRIAFALALVLATFNPSGFSYFHWVSGTFPSFTPAQVVLGIALLILWIFLWRSMMQAVGKTRFPADGGVHGRARLALRILGLARPGQCDDHDWVVLVALGLILGVGMSWAIVRQGTHRPGARWTISTTSTDQLRFERIFSARACISVESASPRISLASRTYSRTASAASGLLIR